MSPADVILLIREFTRSIRDEERRLREEITRQTNSRQRDLYQNMTSYLTPTEGNNRQDLLRLEEKRRILDQCRQMIWKIDDRLGNYTMVSSNYSFEECIFQSSVERVHIEELLRSVEKK